MLNMTSNRNGTANAGALWALAFWRRPRSRWDVAVLHLPLALIFGGALLLPHTISLNKLPLIDCTFLELTGYPCPLCGFTRSFWAIAEGQWMVAMVNCPLAFPVYLLMVVLAAWHVAALLSNVILSRGPMLRPGPRHRRKIAFAVLCLFSLNWFYRLGMGLT